MPFENDAFRPPVVIIVKLHTRHAISSYNDRFSKYEYYYLPKCTSLLSDSFTRGCVRVIYVFSSVNDSFVEDCSGK